MTVDDLPSQTIQDEARKIADGAAVEFKEVPYTLAELRAAMDELIDNPNVTQSQTREDLTGIEVVPLAGSASRGSNSIPARSSSGVPITVDPAEPLMLTAEPEAESNSRLARNYVRRADTKPFHAGARTRGCTTGPAVVNNKGQQFLLTARHCKKSSNWETPAGVRIGYSIATDKPALDTQAIRVDAGVSRAIISGPWNNSGPDHLTVTGSVAPSFGWYLCNLEPPRGSPAGFESWVTRTSPTWMRISTSSRRGGPGLKTPTSSFPPRAIVDPPWYPQILIVTETK